MSFEIKNFLGNDDITQVDQKGCFRVLEYDRDLSVTYGTAQREFFASQMGIKKRQLVIQLNNQSIILQKGAMQWTLGPVTATTGLKGAGDFIKKAFQSQVTGESAIKPEYSGNGIVVTEPTYKHLIILDLDDWNNGLIIEDGLFLAADSEVQQKAVRVKTLSAMALGNEGLFNLGLFGTGFVVLESFVPKEELIEIHLENDELKIDGSLAIAWSSSLDFTVERSGKTLIGSSVSGEGLVNVYRGTGTVLMSPVAGAYSPVLTGKTETSTSAELLGGILGAL